MKNYPSRPSISSSLSSDLSRREFLRTSAMAAALVGVAHPFHILRAQTGSPNEKLNIAAIGVAGIAKGVPAWINQHHRLAAICDVDEAHPFGSENIKIWHGEKGVPFFKDYRVMFDKMGKELDGVIISTPDHSHFGPTIAALQLGIATFTQKPLTQTIDQSRRLIKAAQETGLATQMGIQGHSKEAIRNMKEWIDAGLLGEIKEVHTWFFERGGGSDASGYPAPEPIPSTMAWDLWLGPTREREHSSEYYPTSKWRRWLDFGSSLFGDFGTHIIDGPFYCLDLPLPTRVQVHTPTLYKFTWPVTGKVTFDFPAGEKHPAIKLHWYGGEETKPLLPSFKDIDPDFDPLNYKPSFGAGAFIVGSKRIGVIHGLTCDNTFILPRSKMAELQSEIPPKTIPRVKGDHSMNFTDGIRDKSQQPCAHFGYSGRLTEVCLVGSIAVRLARPELVYDPVKGEFPGDDEATQLAKGFKPRQGWEGLA